ncbi:MAG TPA: hypothetical protein VHC43_13690 [Mycobacteriales bacterium]|nr:hypothetical protein [Mycobacteriales bacterium]
MFTSGNHDQARLARCDLASGYETKRDRVDAAHQRMRAITAVPHRPAQAREAARELTDALRVATDAASRALQAAARAEPSPRHHLRHVRADRSVPAAVRPWSAELVRLAEIGVWLRRTTLDDDGVQLPKTVRVANYAAKGPHIAGLDFGNQAAEPPGGPRIGIDLAATSDATGRVGCAGPFDRGLPHAATATKAA